MNSNKPFDELMLIEKMIRGDMNSFDALYWKYFKAVHCNILKLVHDSTAADDILQDVFLSLWEHRDKISSARSLAGWLFVSSYNRSLTFLKKQLREKGLSSVMSEGSMEMKIELSLDEIRLNELEWAISKLSPQKRKVFYLCKIKGLSYAETADQLNISKNTVKEYLSAAFQSIKDQLIKSPSIGLVAWIFLRFF